MKPSLPKGTRDFLPGETIKRKYLFEKIESVFVKYGYVPIETPTLENLSTLTGKYGEEGDNLLFKVLNNGDFLAKVQQQDLDDRDSKKVVSQISKRGLRYDLTVPFARYVVMHQNDLSFPFKRYQMQPVWRADRPQKGRYQEFYQCDVDVVGSDSLMYEAELLQIFDEVFSLLGISVEIKLNHRKILMGISELAGIPDRFVEFTTAIDKLDKIGEDKVLEELISKGIEPSQAKTSLTLLNQTPLELAQSFDGKSESGSIGIAELKEVYQYFDPDQANNKVSFDATLARGLSYYTGCIFEVKALDAKIGSIGGGGRYADLTEVFGMKDVPGVGISFGAERIYDVMCELDLFPASLSQTLDLLIISFDKESHLHAFQLCSNLRKAGFNVDLYPSPDKFKKQMKYADSIGVPRVGIIGPEEVNAQSIQLKNMETGHQKSVTQEELISELKDANS